MDHIWILILYFYLPVMVLALSTFTYPIASAVSWLLSDENLVTLTQV